ncbi:MAG: hypothetical protein IPF92_21830 [Myxococcales bacterium]|nr:hypothetical protein [Myxococcales bacterium]HQY62540.1 hypothetical protein [Polyangiaceae bacterium]
MLMTRSLFARLSTLAALALVPACSAETGVDDPSLADSEDDLTSLTALSREVRFSGVVYVERGASNDTILRAVHTQTKSAFGPLREASIAVNNRELKGVDPATFVKREVEIVDTVASPTGAGSPMTEVRYTYVDNGVVDKLYARRTSVSLAVLNPSYTNQSERILTECTANDSHARDFATSLWYVFDPSGAACKAAIKTESEKVATERGKLRDARTQVAKAEAERLYVPIRVALGANKTNRGTSYPEYDRLYKGGVEQGALVVSLVYGMIDHEAHGNPSEDYAWGQLMDNMSEIYKTRPGLKLVRTEGESLTTLRLASGKTFDNVDFKELVDLDAGRGFRGVSSAEATEVRNLVGTRITRKWLTFEAPVKVSVGGEAERDFKQKVIVYYGAESDSTPHKFAIKNSDVFLYNGHSYIGFGPLDPSRFTAADFPKSYQILFIDGCVSYNYYEKDYIPLKEGGTANLDLITNGLEAPSFRSGFALGRFVSTLLNGTNASYKDLLSAASATDSLRVVDGEVDNVFRPTRTAVKVR